jgi:hypothetical protein
VSSELLRRAATELRDISPTGTYADPGGIGSTGEFFDAVADWLEAESQAHFHHPIRGEVLIWDQEGIAPGPAHRVAALVIGETP